MSNVEGRMSALEAGMSKLEARVSNEQIRISTLERRMGNIEDVVAALNTEIRTWPDMHFLGAAAKLQMTHTREIKTEVADIGVRVKEIFQAMATDPEIKSLREEVSRFRDRSLTIEVRLGALEGRLGVKHEVDA
jgi:predicted  nucleic acid-binding Zn-ribbon protein